MYLCLKEGTLTDKVVQIYLKQTYFRHSKVKQYNRSLSLLASQEVGRLKLKNVPRNSKK